MKPFFEIAPWEYAGADFDPNPQTVVRSSVNDHGKTWWLKVRDGIIYFRDAAKVRVFAVPQRFLDLNPNDSEQLIQIWQREIERENYGSHLISRRTWPGTRATSSFCIVLRADGSGTIREHFDADWREFQLDLPKTLDLWAVQTSDAEVEQIIKLTRAQFWSAPLTLLTSSIFPSSGAVAASRAMTRAPR